MTVQGPITFQDVAASFTEQHWLYLADWQKEIYKNVVKEIQEAIMSLGYIIINPSIVFSVKRQDKSSVRVDDRFIERNARAGDIPNLLLKIKDELAEETPIDVEKEPNVAQHFPPSPAMTSASFLNVRMENAAHGQTHTSFPPRKSYSFPIKAEDDAYPVEDYYRTGDDPRYTTRGDDFIKPESDEETDTDEEVQDRNSDDNQSRGDSTPLDMLSKKRKIGSHIHGDLLGLDDTEVRRVRIMENTVEEFDSEPGFPFHPASNDGVKRERAKVPSIGRDITNTNWCDCGHCDVMSSLEESICCHEISSLIPQLTDERFCITMHPAFRELCLDQDRLDFLYRFLARIKRKNDILYHLHKLRRTSYRAFVVWAHGFLDFRNYKPIPACVVKHVQESLPYPEELNVGYMKMQDYPAAIMALDHI
ncbi:uncharacterized protein RB166_010376 [Leptodactylus fuscus]|uniref:uncharacterized protein LOC142210448 n=1 Tax=Leptodactylus fuscus TaxID=238119 RepID=UPI003F4ED07C